MDILVVLSYCPIKACLQKGSVIVESSVGFLHGSQAPWHPSRDICDKVKLDDLSFCWEKGEWVEVITALESENDHSKSAFFLDHR